MPLLALFPAMVLVLPVLPLQALATGNMFTHPNDSNTGQSSVSNDSRLRSALNGVRMGFGNLLHGENQSGERAWGSVNDSKLRSALDRVGMKFANLMQDRGHGGV